MTDTQQAADVAREISEQIRAHLVKNNPRIPIVGNGDGVTAIIEAALAAAEQRGRLRERERLEGFFIRLRNSIVTIHDGIQRDDPGRAYFGSTNDADKLSDIFHKLDDMKWDQLVRDEDARAAPQPVAPQGGTAEDGQGG